MRALARESGLSANALSMIERGLTSPSVSTLSKLANALGVPITAFFREEPVRSRIVFSKAGDRNELTFMRGRWEGLGGERFEGRVDAFLITLEGGATSGPHGMLHTGHGGQPALCRPPDAPLAQSGKRPVEGDRGDLRF
jgi:transcriptional regulator with XRE-family HTH domain